MSGYSKKERLHTPQSTVPAVTKEQPLQSEVPSLSPEREKFLHELSSVLNEIFSSPRPNAKNWRNRTVIVQSFIHKLSDREIARQQQISPTHVARIKQRFLKEAQRFRHRFNPQQG